MLAGVEAIISHLIVKEFRIPCAHGPALLPLPMSPSLSPRSAAEEGCPKGMTPKYSSKPLVPRLSEFLGVNLSEIIPRTNKFFLMRVQRPNFLPRITLANIWELASRESCGRNVWETLKASIAILFRQSTLQEPAFQELILLFTDESTQSRS